jgi:hypothetical protein
LKFTPMGSSSIPSSNPVTGRISMPSSSKSRRLSSCFVRHRVVAPSCLFHWVFDVINQVFGLTESAKPRTLRFVNVQRSTIASPARTRTNAQRSMLNAQRSMGPVERCTLNVERWTLLPFRRVKGAWWPSRSSKPSSVGNGRGRFDSYPLRVFLCCSRPALSGRQWARRQSAVTTVEISEDRR